VWTASIDGEVDVWRVKNERHVSKSLLLNPVNTAITQVTSQSCCFTLVLNIIARASVNASTIYPFGI
jgi:hypothetical protein